VAETVPIPGRLERVAEHPPTFIDAAHNPDGAAALAEALPAVAEGRRVVACLAILADKDAAAMIQALAPTLTHAIATQLPADGPKSRPGGGKSAHRPSVPAQELAAMCREAGVEAEAEVGFEAALGRARALALEAPEGVLLVAGSNYGIAPARAALGL
jgi:dihydrofolate synthase/folylpolyglutamate synthase